ncbi:MAG: hypothetical protein GTO54_06225, partial [Nitrososphaeria archaeon]|nr:hypothetical protein [Nitrososphaeria archaeon]
MEWYNDRDSFEEGDTIHVEYGQETPDRDVVLEEGGFIEGRVTDPNGSGIENVSVEVYDKTRSIFYSRGWTDENGYYSAPHLPTGDVKVFFDTGSTS